MSAKVVYFIVISVVVILGRFIHSASGSAIVDSWRRNDSSRARKRPSNIEYAVAVSSPFVMVISFLLMVAVDETKFAFEASVTCLVLVSLCASYMIWYGLMRSKK